jgi:hypothetical protein
MVSKTSSSDVNAPNYGRESISDEDLIRGFILALGAEGRKQKALTIYETAFGCCPASPGALTYRAWQQ